LHEVMARLVHPAFGLGLHALQAKFYGGVVGVHRRKLPQDISNRINHQVWLVKLYKVTAVGDSSIKTTRRPVITAQAGEGGDFWLNLLPVPRGSTRSCGEHYNEVLIRLSSAVNG
jgi:hypothetical protein